MAQIILPGRYVHLAKIAEFVRQAAREAGLDDSAVYQVETAVDEACTNIIEHAYGGESDDQIRIEAEVNPQGLILTLHDTGKPFKPEKIRKPNLKSPLSKRDNHGLGLFIMTQWMDEVRFHFDPATGNTLVMIKNKA